MHYLNLFVPDKYHCKQCSTHGVKLWRHYAAFNTSTTLLNCAECTIISEGKSGKVDDDGTFQDGKIKNTSIGWFVPALLGETESWYWNELEAPLTAWKWWMKLPNRK